MKPKVLTFSAALALLAALLIISGGPVLGQGPAQGPGGGDATLQSPLGPQVVASDSFTYQGRLTKNGAPLTDVCSMAFRLYGAPSSGGSIGDPITATLPVTGGLFTMQLPWEASFYGYDRWLDVAVKCSGDSVHTALSPRQQITGAPYAFTLRPGAIVRGDVPGYYPLYVINEGTVDRSSGIRSQVGAPRGRGLFGLSAGDGGMGVYGFSYDATGAGVAGYAGINEFSISDFGSQKYGVYGEGAALNSIGIYGTAPHTGVVGIATSTNDSSIGVYGESNSLSSIAGYFVNKASWGGSGWALRGEGLGSGGGVFGSTYGGQPAVKGWSVIGTAGEFRNDTDAYFTLHVLSPVNSGPALYVAGASYFTGAKTGYVVDVCVSEDDLEPGDVVVIAGSRPPVLGDIPVVVVRKAREAYARGVFGVVDVRQVVNPTARPAGSDDPDSSVAPEAAVHFAEGAISSGDYLLVVTLGAYKAIKVDASYGAIKPGDLLVSSPKPGYAMLAQAVMVQGVPIYPSGVIIGKALGALETGAGTIPVLVTLD